MQIDFSNTCFTFYVLQSTTWVHLFVVVVIVVALVCNPMKIIANSKVKDYKSLTNKTIFKFMDLIDM